MRRFTRCLWIVASVCCLTVLFALAPEASAQGILEEGDPYPEPGDEPGEAGPADAKPVVVREPATFSLGGTLLKEHGFSVMARFRAGHFAVDAAYGFSPYFIWTNEADCDVFVVDLATHATVSVLYTWSRPSARTQKGLRLGGMRDGNFGTGILIGSYWGKRVGKSAEFHFGAGAQIYPDGEDRARDRLAEECGSAAEDVELDAVDSFMQLYIGIGLLFDVF